jgi:hypothetical protein
MLVCSFWTRLIDSQPPAKDDRHLVDENAVRAAHDRLEPRGALAGSSCR